MAEQGYDAGRHRKGSAKVLAVGSAKIQATGASSQLQPTTEGFSSACPRPFPFPMGQAHTTGATGANPSLPQRATHRLRSRKVLGGSSSINGMVYVRGHPCDFDHWVAEGAEGWSYAATFLTFRRAERWIGGEDRYRGGAADPSIPATATGWTTLFTKPSSKLASKRAMAAPRITTVIGKRALAPCI